MPQILWNKTLKDCFHTQLPWNPTHIVIFGWGQAKGVRNFCWWAKSHWSIFLCFTLSPPPQLRHDNIFISIPVCVLSVERGAEFQLNSQICNLWNRGHRPTCSSAQSRWLWFCDGWLKSSWLGYIFTMTVFLWQTSTTKIMKIDEGMN